MAIPPLVRVKVERGGRVLLDEVPTTLAALKKAMPGIKKKNARVRYYREGGPLFADVAAFLGEAGVLQPHQTSSSGFSSFGTP